MRPRKITYALILGFILYAQPVLSRPYGPLWKVWTHSRDSNECNVKTAFWFALSITSTALAINKINKKWNNKIKNRVELTHEGLTIYWKK